MAVTEMIASVLGDSSFAEFERQIIEKHQQEAEREIIDKLNQLLAFTPYLKCLRGLAAKAAYRFWGFREIRIRLQSGNTWAVRSPVFLKAKAKAKRGRPRKRRQAVLEHLGLQWLGITEKVSPALTKACACLAALCPSFEVAAGALCSLGIQMNQQLLQNIVCRFADLAIKVRCSCHEDDCWQRPGLKILVCVDGGRFRQRRLKRGKRKQGQNRPGFHSDWVEPRLLTISQFDDQGQKIKSIQPIIDGSAGSLEDFFDLLKQHLKRMNLAQAAEIVFCADGGNGLWPRIDQLIKDLGLRSAKRILDYTHAKQNLGPIADWVAEAMGASAKKRADTFRHFCDLLWKGEIDVIVGIVKVQLSGRPERLQAAEKKLDSYFGDRTMFQYHVFREKGLPLGSGTVESAIRRVINLRIKGSGMFWKRENAEKMILLRSLVLTGRLQIALEKVSRNLEFLNVQTDLDALSPAA
jgi:hypothetical protein